MTRLFYFRRGKEWAAYVVENGRAHLTTVQVGHTSGVETEVLSGLTPGAQVMLHSGDKVVEGTWIQRRSSS